MRYIISLIIAISLIISPAYSSDGFLSSRVKDISDRNYEKAVIELLDSAKRSIVVSMYSINVTPQKRSPANLLLNHLLEARERGVRVELYINTSFRNIDKSHITLNPNIKDLEKAGCVIHIIPSHKKLHDKLVIVDKRYIAEGSNNWSIRGLRVNFESSTLIDSPDLAKIKLQRLKSILVKTKPKEKHVIRPYYAQKLPKRLSIADKLLTDRGYFCQMVTRHDERAFELYLLLLARSQVIRKREFFLSLEDMGLSLRLPASSTNTALRRQAIRSLKNLKRRYNLIDVEFFHGKNAIIKLHSIPGEDFSIRSDSIINLKGLTLRSKFLLLIEAYLRANGEDIDNITTAALSKRFGMSKTVFFKARKDLDLLDSGN